jgi:hypothetical protein
MCAFDFLDVGSQLGSVCGVVAVRYPGEHKGPSGHQSGQIMPVIFKTGSLGAIAILRICGDIPWSDSSLRFRRILSCGSEFMILSVIEACWIQS